MRVVLAGNFFVIFVEEQKREDGTQRFVKVEHDSIDIKYHHGHVKNV